ncbi:MAG: ribonuclease HII [Gammaproteobacteria bacterium RIFCSPLOWO2_12_47_11]|nr:MAG: ribonuclease HII [Gammaproteobacteria bacterium RIFCSPLOWO2_12_47_11]
MQGPEYKIPENTVIAGVDEVGRGPLAGPVIAAAVILDPERPIYGLADSKSINEKKREKLAQEIMLKSRAWAIARAEVYEIDELNILQASLLAMCRSVDALNIKPGLVLVDGKHCPEMELPVKAIIKGDTKVAAISAASIIAKVARDREMTDLDHEYPGYGFAVHKGYPTMAHIQALKQLGACPIHRRSFAPVKNLSQN